jgi:putative SOS response-associated peptidase YedK
VCGRYAFYSPLEAVTRLFGVTPAAAIAPRYNIAPTQFVPIVRCDAEGVRRLALLYWGLVPFWAKEKSIGARMINARAETVAEKPAFRAAYRQRRCLVLAGGYYEWQATPSGKQPYFIKASASEPFAMAGLWESWLEREGGDPLESCTIITTQAYGVAASIHDRMPLILPRAAYNTWLAPATPVAEIDALASSEVTTELVATTVSRRVNSSRNEGPELLDPVSLSD